MHWQDLHFSITFFPFFFFLSKWPCNDYIFYYTSRAIALHQYRSYRNSDERHKPVSLKGMVEKGWRRIAKELALIWTHGFVSAYATTRPGCVWVTFLNGTGRLFHHMGDGGWRRDELRQSGMGDQIAWGKKDVLSSPAVSGKAYTLLVQNGELPGPWSGLVQCQTAAIIWYHCCPALIHIFMLLFLVS